jgi:hypothetical protein
MANHPDIAPTKNAEIHVSGDGGATFIPFDLTFNIDVSRTIDTVDATTHSDRGETRLYPIGTTVTMSFEALDSKNNPALAIIYRSKDAGDTFLLRYWKDKTVPNSYLQARALVNTIGNPSPAKDIQKVSIDLSLNDVTERYDTQAV